MSRKPSPIPWLLALLASCSGPCTARENCEERGGTYVTVECHDEDTATWVPDGNGGVYPIYGTDTVCSHRCDRAKDASTR